MAGTMSQADLVADLKRSLNDSARLFDAPADGDFVRFLQKALPDMGWKRPVTRLGQVTLVAGKSDYPVTDYPDFYAYKHHLWDEIVRIQPWEPGYPGAVPRVTGNRDAAQNFLAFSPAPTASQLAARGSVFKFYYLSSHTLGETPEETTVAPGDRGLLLLRAQAEAVMELTLRGLTKAVQLRDGLSGTPRNSTPRALYDALIAAFEEAR
jgi:hypothetical protein